MAIGKNTKPLSSWRQIQQKNKRGATTKVARKRYLVTVFRAASVVFLLVAIVTGIFAIRYFGKVAEDVVEPTLFGTVELTFQSNGVLTETWFRQMFPDIAKAELRQIDVHSVKDQLEALGQVSSASVTVSLPSLLQVQLEEREPILRIKIRESDGGGRSLLVARDGVIYDGALYPPETLLRLPGASGLRVRRNDDGYVPLEGLEPVAEILDRAKERLPALYRHWQIVDLSDWNPELDYRPALVRISSSHIEELIFSTDGIEAQIERLSGIMDHIQRYQLGQPKLIDLSFGEEAVIRYN